MIEDVLSPGSCLGGGKMETLVGRLVRHAVSIMQRILSGIELRSWEKAEKAAEEMPAAIDALKKEIAVQKEEDAA